MIETWGPYPQICECGKKHIWAFYYVLKRRGDNPWVTDNHDGTINIHRERRDGNSE